MTSEVDVYGVYLPSILVLALIALVITRVAVFVLGRLGAYRMVWHRSLFDISLFVIVLGAVVFFVNPLLGTPFAPIN